MAKKNLTAVYVLGVDGKCGARHISCRTEEELANEIRLILGGRFMFLPAATSDVNVLELSEARELDLPKNPFIGGVYGSAVLLHRDRRSPYRLEGFDEGQIQKVDKLFEKKKCKIRERSIPTVQIKQEQEETV